MKKTLWKFAAMMLCICLALGLLGACGKTDEPAVSEKPDTEESSAPAEEEAQTPDPEPEEVPAPSPDDALTNAALITGIDPGLVISYPDTLKIVDDYDHHLEFDAVKEDYPANNLMFIVTDIGTGYDHHFTSGAAQAEAGLKAMAQQWIEQVYGSQIVQITDSGFYDGGTYYSYRLDVWFDPSVYMDYDGGLIRGVIKFRYAGPIGQLFVAEASGDAEIIDNYVAILDKMIVEAKFGGGQWSTGTGGTGGGSDGRGDVIYDDGWGDVIYEDGMGDIIYDDGWGDIVDEDYWYDEDTGTDYYWDEDGWYESNDAGW